MSSAINRLAILRELWAASVFGCLIWMTLSCRSADVNWESRHPLSSRIDIQCLQDSLGEGASSLVSSRDGRLYVLEPGSWRIKVFQDSGGQISEIDLGPGRYLMAGGALQGMAVLDITRGILSRYDQQGSRVMATSLGDRQIDALWLTSSGEYLFLDGIAGRVMVHNEGLREIRIWNLKGRGRPQAIAGDPLEGLVAVSYPHEGRIDTYSLLGVFLESRPFPVRFGEQAIAFDQSGRIPGARALSMAPKDGVLILGRGTILKLSP